MTQIEGPDFVRLDSKTILRSSLIDQVLIPKYLDDNVYELIVWTNNFEKEIIYTKFESLEERKEKFEELSDLLTKPWPVFHN